MKYMNILFFSSNLQKIDNWICVFQTFKKNYGVVQVQDAYVLILCNCLFTDIWSNVHWLDSRSPIGLSKYYNMGCHYPNDK